MYKTQFKTDQEHQNLCKNETFFFFFLFPSLFLRKKIQRRPRFYILFLF
uniref:Uncharacterized protein n=1 Tax=Rhizophora mucronata TaxID=61149 RepID=A0A2P2NA80_RHIMU